MIDNEKNIYYFQNDAVGLPQEICDAKGKIAWSASYDAQGNIEKLFVNEIDNPIRFQGQYYDSEIDLCYNRYRYFDPKSCRFISQDPLGLIAGENLYRYAFNVWGWVDPLGLSCDKNTSKTQTDLYAFGNKDNPRPPRPRVGEKGDISVDDIGMVKGQSPPNVEGASAYGDVNEAHLTGQYHKLLEGTDLPEGLGVIPDGIDVGGTQPRTHHTIYPTREMPKMEFDEKFLSLGWEHAGNKKK